MLKPEHLQHSHTFGQDKHRRGEQRTVIVVVITAATMVIEIAGGLVFGSVALLSDGLHMGSHAAALSISVFAYRFARRNADNPRYSFGTGKVNALAGFSSAVTLLMFALVMAYECIDRFFNPVAIGFDQAIAVAVLGLLVNGASMFILHVHHDDEEHHHDHNLRSAYLHVLADTLTSLLAISALLAGKYFGLLWMDPLMGLVGTALVARWAVGLLRSTSNVLLDHQGPESSRASIISAVEGPDGQAVVTDIHLWSIGPGIYSLQLSLAAENPKTPVEYKSRLPNNLSLVHVTIEVNPV